MHDYKPQNAKQRYHNQILLIVNKTENQFQSLPKKTKLNFKTLNNT